MGTPPSPFSVSESSFWKEEEVLCEIPSSKLWKFLPKSR